MKRLAFPPMAVLMALVFTATSSFASFNAGSNTFAMATVVSTENDYSSATYLIAYSKENNEPGHTPSGVQGGQNSAWWTWTAPSNGFCTVDTLEGVSAPTYVQDTLIAVYTGNTALSFLDGTNGAGLFNAVNSGGELENGNLIENLTLSTANKFTFDSKVRKPSLTLNKASGLVSGSITEVGKRKRTIRGMLTLKNGIPVLRGHVTGITRNVFFQITD